VRLQELIRNADPDEINFILKCHTQLEPVDPMRRELVSLIVEQGLSPWIAARKVFEMGVCERSQSTIYYHATQLSEELCRHLGYDVTGQVMRLRSEGEIICEREEARLVVESALANEWRVQTEDLVRIRFLGRKDEWRRERGGSE